jgi:multidrug efflux pump subunit AcrA (membrane-fusion protein)
MEGSHVRKDEVIARIESRDVSASRDQAAANVKVAQANLEQARFTSLPGPSAFVSDFPSGELEQDDGSGRLALIYDTRDNEYNTHQGLLL